MQFTRTANSPKSWGNENFSNRNERLVLSEILFRGPLPRTEVAERIGLTQASISRITRNLIEAGLVEETGQQYEEAVKPGRKRIGVKARSDGGYVAGIAINAFQQDIVIADLTNGKLAEKRLNFPSLDQAEYVLPTCASELKQLVSDAGIDRKRLFGCGVTIAGAIEPGQGKVRFSPTLGWSNVDVMSLVEPIIAIPVAVESIPNAKNLAAHCFGPTRGKRTVVLFNCSLGIGASLLVDNVLLRGPESNVGMIDSMLIPDENTGEMHSFDLMAGGFGVIGDTRTKAKHSGCEQARRLIEAIEDNSLGKVQVHRSLEQAGRSLAFVIMMANSFLHPQTILLSGPMIESSVYRNAVLDRVSQLIGKHFAEEKIVFYRLSNRDAARSLAIHHFLVDNGFSWKASRLMI